MATAPAPAPAAAAAAAAAGGAKARFAQLLEEFLIFTGWKKKQLTFSTARPLIKGTGPSTGKPVCETLWFNCLIVACIVTDSIAVGIEIDSNSSDSASEAGGYWMLDILLACIFLTEMGLRQRAHGWEYFSDAWNVFDYICVLLTISSIVQPSRNASANAKNVRVIKALKSFRVLRLLRVVRHLWGLKIVEGLFLLISAVIHSIRTLFWVFVFAFLITYCFAVGLCTVATGDDKMLFWENSQIYLGGVLRCMLTVWQVITFDDWTSDIARPLIEIEPIGGVLLFGCIFVIAFGILNVIVATMVEHIRSTVDETNMMAARKLKDTEAILLEKMGADFYMWDADHTGELDYAEFTKLIHSESFVLKMHLLGLQTSEVDMLFKLLDADESGSVSAEEFIAGMNKITGPATGRDLLQVICFAQRQCRRAKTYVDRVRRLQETADVMQVRLNKMGAAMTAELVERDEANKHFVELKQTAVQREVFLKEMDIIQRASFPTLIQESPYSPR